MFNVYEKSTWHQMCSQVLALLVNPRPGEAISEHSLMTLNRLYRFLEDSKSRDSDAEIVKVFGNDPFGDPISAICQVQHVLAWLAGFSACSPIMVSDIEATRVFLKTMLDAVSSDSLHEMALS